MGIGGGAATITVIGLVMGLAYGGGLIMHDVHKGKVERRDVFPAISLMSLSHALIEDTLLMYLIGATMWGTFVGRLLFSLLVVAALSRLTAGLARPRLA
jgi:glycerol uptake facilitator-like aquaporin